MKIQIFDVSHGFCAYLVADNGNVMLFDCGHNDKTGFRPSEYLQTHRCTAIETFFIMNYDEDHLSDLVNLRQLLPIKVLWTNKSISPDTLRELKQESGPISAGLAAAIDMTATYTAVVTEAPDYPSTDWVVFHNSYPAFTDTNNLSLVVFIYYDGMGIVLPGDLEQAGWNALLQDGNFREHLKHVNIFVASHHGRRTGYCETVFDYCKPDIIIISDEEVQYDTQHVDYQKHAYGLPWHTMTDKRYVLTTRSDGMITITKNIGEGYRISI
ncbi:MAG: hypothetical protein AB1664_03755 [Thermodesulfobacteriota bacterium]